jgi:hypothetical protein
MRTKNRDLGQAGCNIDTMRTEIPKFGQFWCGQEPQILGILGCNILAQCQGSWKPLGKSDFQRLRHYLGTTTAHSEEELWRRESNTFLCVIPCSHCSPFLLVHFCSLSSLIFQLYLYPNRYATFRVRVEPEEECRIEVMN